MSRQRFIQILDELRAVDSQIASLYDKKQALEQERDQMWPPDAPAPSEMLVSPTSARATVVGGIGQPLPVLHGAIKTDGPTAKRHVLAYMQRNAGPWMRARTVCDGMQLPERLVQAVRASLDRLVEDGALEKNAAGEFRAQPGATAAEEADA